MPDPPLTYFPEFPGIPPIGWIDPFSPIAGILPINAPIPVVPTIQAKDPQQNEFRLDGWPPKVQQLFSEKGDPWLKAVDEAIGADIRFRNSSDLADLIFFMQHPERMTAGVGKLIDKNEEDFFKLRAEWNLYRTIATRRLDPSAKPTVFLPANPSNNYEDYVAAQTTGRITLMINGRNWNPSKSVKFDDQAEAFNSMQKTVESLGPNDSVFLATWQFIWVEGDNGNPNLTPLTLPSPTGMKTWIDLFKSKANDGVKIRIIISELRPYTPEFMTDIEALKAVTLQLPPSTRDNLKYIVTFPGPLAVHHQKFMVARKGGKDGTIIAYCGGLDISRSRTPASWGTDFVWHDIHAKLEGRIARDLEREFVLRWNREKDKSTAGKLPKWEDFETLVQAPVDNVDKEADKNTHKLQMLRTVSVGDSPFKNIPLKRDDIWQGYFLLIGRATRFIFMENQYFHEPKLADAIVKQAQAQPHLIVIIVSSSKTDDPNNFVRKHGLALQLEFFTRLSALGPNRLGVYTMFYKSGLVHSKLILVDDQVLSMGSANANPRGFFLDTELNVMLDDAEAVKRFRHRLWSHDLGTLPAEVAEWKISEFIKKWKQLADANNKKNASDQMVGEGVIPFNPIDPRDPRFEKGEKSPIMKDRWIP